MRKRVTILIVCVVIAAAVVVTVHHFTDAKKVGLPAVGSVIPVAGRPMAPPIQGTTLTGTHLNVASLRGAPVVLNFWGSWCSPCQAEAPILAQVASATRHLGVHFVGVDIRDNAAQGVAFEQQHGITYPSFNDPNDMIAAEFGTMAPGTTPSTYILDARGRIAWAFFGGVSYGQLDSAVLRVAG
jgi:thiol-disulfide isomerase/thioredoxin